MKILRLQAENIKKLKVVDITPTEDLVQITGRNGQGKTSVLDSILFALAGKDAIDAVPLRRGESQGKIVIDLGEAVGMKDWTVTRTFSEREGTQLTLTNKLGTNIVRGGDKDKLGPQQTIASFMAKITMDPLEFVRLGRDAKGRREQAEQLRRMVELPIDLEKVEAEQKADYDRRRYVKQEADRLKTTIEGQEPIPEGISAEPIDVSQLAKELEKAGEHNRKVEQQKARRAAILRDAEDVQTQINGNTQRIEELRRQIAELEKANREGYKDHLRIIGEAEKLKIEKPIDVSAVSQKITDAERNNGWVRRRGDREKLEAERIRCAVELEELQYRMSIRDEEKRDAFAKARMPVDGLTFTSDGVYWQGLPLEQASGAEQLRVSMAVAMAANPKLRVLRIVDGSLLDDESLDLIRAEARKRDFQIWIEGVDTSGEVGFVLSEGEVISTPQSRGEKAAKPSSGTRQKKAK